MGVVGPQVACRPPLEKLESMQSTVGDSAVSSFTVCSKTFPLHGRWECLSVGGFLQIDANGFLNTLS